MAKVKKVTHRNRRVGGAGVVGRIAPISSKTLDAISINVYGRSGSGKTTFACSFPKPLLLIGAEDGTQSVHDVKGVEFVRLESSEEVRELVDHVKQHGRYKTVVLDTASSLQDLILKEILGIDKLPEQRSWGMASRENWGQCVLQTKEMLRALLNLRTEDGCSVVIVAQEREFNTDSESEILMPYVGSALTPSVTGWLNPACDYIVQTFIRRNMVSRTVKVGGKAIKRKEPGKGVQYCIRTAPDEVYTTKFRLPKGTQLPEDVDDPSYDKIMKLIRGG